MFFTYKCVSLTNTFADCCIISCAFSRPLFDWWCFVKCVVPYLLPSLVLAQRSGVGGWLWQGSSTQHSACCLCSCILFSHCHHHYITVSILKLKLTYTDCINYKMHMVLCTEHTWKPPLSFYIRWHDLTGFALTFEIEMMKEPRRQHEQNTVSNCWCLFGIFLPFENDLARFHFTALAKRLSLLFGSIKMLNSIWCKDFKSYWH